MAGESLEIQLTRLDERLGFVLKELEESKASRSKQSQAMEDIRLSVSDIQSRVGNVEAQLAADAPTINEFVAIKNKVAGAGMIGKWLWVGVGIVIGALANGRMNLGHLFKWS